MKFLCSVFLTLHVLGVSMASQAQTFESTDVSVPLIELYTSEGCSSCPPAERWLSKLSDHEKLWRDFVPVAFHVDYWDYIGWKDPFASKEFSHRQRRYAHEFNENTVYTPGMRKGGEEWRNWRHGGRPDWKNDTASEAVESESENTSAIAKWRRWLEGSKTESSPLVNTNVGKVAITIDESGAFNASFESEEIDSTQLTLNVAILGVDLSSEVTSGENHGKTLEHNFVVLGISTYANGDESGWSGQLPEPSVEAPRYAVAAWVTKGQSLRPIQATGGYLAQK